MIVWSMAGNATIMESRQIGVVFAVGRGSSVIIEDMPYSYLLPDRISGRFPVT